MTDAKHLDINHGLAFPNPIRIGSWVFGSGGLLLLLNGTLPSIIIAIVILTAVAYISTTSSGVLMESNRFKTYTTYFGFQKGEWKSRDKFPDVSVLSARVSSSMISRGNARISAKETQYKVYMLTKTHRTRVLLNSFSTKAEAMELAKKLKEEYGFELNGYNPKKG